MILGSQRYLVPKIWATIPLVAGTVDNHKIPKLAPNIIEVIVLGGVKINRHIESPLKKYMQLNINFLLVFVDRYPLAKDPKILNRPINDNIIAAVQSSSPRSITYFGTCVPTNVI